MKRISESGRSMIEMLGVLAIIGVLTIGGLDIVGKARQSAQVSNLVAEISSIAATARRLSCQYDSGYGSYSKMIYLSQAYSDALTYSSNEFTGPMDTTIKITGDKSAFRISVEGLEEDACMRLATTNWGSDKIQGFLGVCIGTCTGGNGTSGGPEGLSQATAAEKCSDDSTVLLNYKGCR